jgi:hypothetical protein
VKYRCWVPEFGENVDDSREVDAADEENAAADHVEWIDENGGFDNYDSSTIVHVRDEAGATWSVQVSPDFSVNFYPHTAERIT